MLSRSLKPWLESGAKSSAAEKESPADQAGLEAEMQSGGETVLHVPQAPMQRKPLGKRPKAAIQTSPIYDADGLDVRAVAAWRFSGSELAVRKHVERGTIPFKRLGRRIYFSRRELEEFWKALDGVSVEQAVARVRGTQ
jgi:hypothetical protein